MHAPPKLPRRPEKMKNQKEKNVTQVSFNKEVKGLHEKIDKVALGLVNTQEDVRQIQETLDTKVATKGDIKIVLDTMDAFIKKMAGFDQEEMVQSLHLQEARVQLVDHEKRLTILESPR